MTLLNTLGSVNSNIRQFMLAIYLYFDLVIVTFGSEFGEVVDVRIPGQQDRMFGFVTFSTPETVKTILSMPNPHFVGRSRVLVKPYREKPKLPNRYSQTI